MTKSDKPKPADDDAALKRRRRLAEVFGDVLPETTSDERGAAPAEERDAWYVENRPPHHEG
ncbi:hypothetical protein C8D88_1011444 [Lentzea atacamensis]|uniref:Uncharacterized protein n=2 Tax=Lentzea TaxID=165301 RepID=A0A316IEK2_9PSEU|nr:hypothetical protein [Lentzea atacamensis]PWK91409.1 hypothetical protein C8D88_1011444 [Lentzea atacamensis]RAS64022.1 hypothetical protein C8D87_106427 [Lentzea atacamensis]